MSQFKYFPEEEKKSLNKLADILWNIWFPGNLAFFSAPAAERGSSNTQHIDLWLSLLRLLQQNTLDWVAWTRDIYF